MGVIFCAQLFDLRVSQLVFNATPQSRNPDVSLLP